MVREGLGYLTDPRDISEETVDYLLSDALDVSYLNLKVVHTNVGQFVYIGNYKYNYDMIQFSDAELFFKSGLQTILIRKRRSLL